MSVESVTYHFIDEISTDELIDLYEIGGWWKEHPRSRANLPALIKGSFCFVIAKVHTRLIGMGRVISDGVSDGYIQDVVVRPEYRGRGIGIELVRQLRDYCLVNQLEWIGLIAESGTAPFYKRLGFTTLDGDVPMLLESHI